MADLRELVDGLASDVTVKVEEQGEVLKLLANNESKGSKHGNTAVGDLALAPAADIRDSGSGGEAKRVPDTSKGSAGCSLSRESSKICIGG